MLLLSKACAFEKIHHAGWHVFELFTGRACCIQVFTLHFRVFRQVLFAVALHKREVECPPGRAHNRHLNQFLLEEEFQQGDTAIQRVLENQNIDPTLVITQNEIPAVSAQVIGALYCPVHFLGQGHPA